MYRDFELFDFVAKTVEFEQLYFGAVRFWNFETPKLWTFGTLVVWNSGILNVWSLKLRNEIADKTGPGNHEGPSKYVLEILHTGPISSRKHEIEIW